MAGGDEDSSLHGRCNKGRQLYLGSYVLILGNV